MTLGEKKDQQYLLLTLIQMPAVQKEEVVFGLIVRGFHWLIGFREVKDCLAKHVHEQGFMLEMKTGDFLFVIILQNDADNTRFIPKNE